MSAISREELDAKLNATEARIDASLARMEGKLEHLPTTANLWIAAASAVVAVVGITATFLTLGADRFNGGFEIGSAQIGKALGVDKIAADNAQQSKDIQALTSSVKTLSTKLDDILTEVKAFKTSQPPNQQK